VLIELSAPASAAPPQQTLEHLLEQALGQGLAADAAVAATGAQFAALWALRENISEAQAAEGKTIKHDIALPISAIADFVRETDAAIAHAFPAARLVVFGHLGDGNLHYNVQSPAGVSAAEFLKTHEAAVNAVVYDQVMAHGGSISAEHGIGQLKREELAQRKSPVALALMRQIKQALDPRGLLNPNRVV
jgi:FAD/FMN-containing dehydrogenase